MGKINISSVPSFIYHYSVSSSKIPVFHNIVSLSLTHTLIIYLSFIMLYIPMHILDTITHHLQQKI